MAPVERGPWGRWDDAETPGTRAPGKRMLSSLTAYRLHLVGPPPHAVSLGGPPASGRSPPLRGCGGRPERPSRQQPLWPRAPPLGGNGQRPRRHGAGPAGSPPTCGRGYGTGPASSPSFKISHSLTREIDLTRGGEPSLDVPRRSWLTGSFPSYKNES